MGVSMRSEDVIRLHIHPSACMELWNRCEVFGQVASELKQSLSSSSLVQTVSTRGEVLDMFFDQSALCNWAHEEVALQPFRQPSDADLTGRTSQRDKQMPLDVRNGDAGMRRARGDALS